MRNKAPFEWYFRSVGAILLFTGLAKLLSISSGRGALFVEDAIVPFRQWQLLAMVAIIELIVAVYVISNRYVAGKAVAVLWLAWNFVLYRLGLEVFRATGCPCLGKYINALPLNAETTSKILGAIVTFLIVGSLFVLLRLRDDKNGAYPNDIGSSTSTIQD
jgi:hypothetical protein